MCSQVSEEREKWTMPTYCFLMNPVFRDIGGHRVRLPWDWVRNGCGSFVTRVQEARQNFVHINRPFVVKGRKWRIIDDVIEPVGLILVILFVITMFVWKYEY